MKRLLILLMLVSANITTVFAQCNPFYNFKEGTTWEITSYNANDKMTGRTVHEIKKLNTTDQGWIATIFFQSFDKKDKMAMEKEIELECENGVIKMDMEKYIPAESLEAFKEMNMTLEMDHLVWPSNLSEGDKLDDGSLTLKSDFMNMTVKITDREVGAREKITTPAGTFDAYKVSFTTTMKMMMVKEIKGVDYIAEGVGVVRSETYNGNGKLTDYTLLTSYK